MEQNNQEQQERMAAEMRRQQQFMQQQQYMANKQYIVMNISNGLQQISPFDVIKMINQYFGICTLNLDPQESMYLNNLISQLFSDPASNFTSENWKNLLLILNNAVSITFNMQTNQMGSRMSGGYSPYGMMGGPQMGGMGMNMGYQQQMGMGMNQFGMNMGYQQPMGMGMNNPYGAGGFNQYNPMGGIPTPGQAPQGESTEQSEEVLINQYKQAFFTRIFQVDPIVFLNCLLQDNYEPKTDNDNIENTLRHIIMNSLWRVQDNILQMIFQVVSTLYNNEYQKKLNSGNKQNQNQNNNQMGMGMGYQQPMGMGMGMGMNMNPFGGGMMPPLNGMGMGMNQFGGQMGPQMGMGMGMNMNPFGGGMMPPLNGMGMNQFNQFGMGNTPYGTGGFSPIPQGSQSGMGVTPIW
jgi:hypothetical protein